MYVPTECAEPRAWGAGMPAQVLSQLPRPVTWFLWRVGFWGLLIGWASAVIVAPDEMAGAIRSWIQWQQEKNLLGMAGCSEITKGQKPADRYEEATAAS